MNDNIFISKRRRKKFSYEVGQRFGRLVYTGKTFTQNAHGHWVRFIECVCDCGEVKNYRFSSVAKGEVQSCGCYRKEKTRKQMSTHGLSNHPLYDVWQKIIDRCYKKTCSAYKDYGGRGIEMWQDWKDDFVCFYDWCIANGWEKGLSVDRIDNDYNYAPQNCRIATTAIQSRNKRSNRYYTAFGDEMCLFDWANDSRCVVSMWTLRSRANNKFWEGRFQEALTTPVEDRKTIASRNIRNYKITAWGETKHMADWRKDSRCKIGINALRDRIKNGWDAEKAMTEIVVRKRDVMITAFGETKSMTNWLKDERCVVKIDAFRTKLRDGWKPEDAMTIRLRT